MWGLFVLHCLHPNWIEPERLVQPRTPFMCANAIPTECIGRRKHITEHQHQSKVLRINFFPNSSKRLKKKKADTLYMAGKSWHQRQMMDLNSSLLYLHALSDSVSVFLLFLARQKTQNLPLGFLFFVIF